MERQAGGDGVVSARSAHGGGGQTPRENRDGRTGPARERVRAHSALTAGLALGARTP